MADPDGTPDLQPPLDPAAERIQRKLRRLVVVSGLTMVLGLGAVLLAIVYRVNRDDAAPGFRFAERLAVPDGWRILGTALDGDRIMIHGQAGTQQSLIVFDAVSGAPLATIALGSEPR